MADIYGTAWKILEEKIARSRKQSISKVDLMEWQLRSLEAAVDRAVLEMVYQGMQSGKQKEA